MNDIISRDKQGMIGGDVIGGRTGVGSFDKNPTKFGFKGDRRARWSDPPAVKQNIEKYVHSEENVNLFRLSKCWISQLQIR